MEFNEDLAVIHAYLCADGYVITNKKPGHKHYHIGFRNTNKVLLSDFARRFKKQFNIKPHDYGDGRKIIQSKKLFYYLTDGFSYYSREWVVPDISKSLLRMWLRAFFDCDGWVSSRKRQNRAICLDSVNFNGLVLIKRVLKEKFDIDSKDIKKRKGRDLYELSIYGKENLKRFQEEINFLHPEKKKKLILALDSFVNYDWIFPKKLAQAKKFVKMLMWEKAKARASAYRQVARMRVDSIKKENLTNLAKLLAKFYGIESKIFGPMVNGYGTEYYELSVHKKEAVKKLLKNNLLNQKEKEKLCKKE